jgi:hypothetical protein
MTAAMRRTIGASDNAALLGGVRAKNNGRYNGNGRHWQTPPEVFDPLNREFKFTLDPCATPETAKCAKFYTEQDDGLSKDWDGERVFMNPPYGREVYAWTRKAREASAGGFLLSGFYLRRPTFSGGTTTLSATLTKSGTSVAVFAF